MTMVIKKKCLAEQSRKKCFAKVKSIYDQTNNDYFLYFLSSCLLKLVKKMFYGNLIKIVKIKLLMLVKKQFSKTTCTNQKTRFKREKTEI